MCICHRNRGEIVPPVIIPAVSVLELWELVILTILFTRAGWRFCIVVQGAVQTSAEIVSIELCMVLVACLLVAVIHHLWCIVTCQHWLAEALHRVRRQELVLRIVAAHVAVVAVGVAARGVLSVFASAGRSWPHQAWSATWRHLVIQVEMRSASPILLI